MHVTDFAQAEAHFAELLGRVQAGEGILVTRADVPVANIMRAGPSRSSPVSVRQKICSTWAMVLHVS